eukprot:Hpha_TRINITY_DN11222_c0_g1::TRINITY_DN11222_c0_g1_i2::g.167582::m.167582
MSAMRVVLAALAMGLLAAVQAEECSHLGERCTSKADCCWKTSCCGGLCCDQPCGDSRCADPCYAARSAQACEAVASECQWCYTPTPPAYQGLISFDLGFTGENRKTLARFAISPGNPPAGNHLRVKCF